MCAFVIHVNEVFFPLDTCRALCKCEVGLGCDLTRHVHHPAVAHSQDLVGLAEQATGADAVCIVSWELLFAGGAAVPPGLGQVGQLSTQRFIRPQSEPPGANSWENSNLVDGGDGGGGGWAVVRWRRPTLCSWHETKVWKPGETPKPSWWM